MSARDSLGAESFGLPESSAGEYAVSVELLRNLVWEAASVGELRRTTAYLDALERCGEPFEREIKRLVSE